MARKPRKLSFDPHVVSILLCSHKCIRNMPLCANREHWIEERLEFLAECFGIDVVGFAVLPSHFDVILRNRPDVVKTWSDDEVARRWLTLCPIRKKEDGSAEEPTANEIEAISNAPHVLAETRTRLSHISWFMKFLAEHIAKLANRADEQTGHLWQERFKSTKIVDQRVLLICLLYVELTEVREGIVNTLEASSHTSACGGFDKVPRRSALASPASCGAADCVPPVGPCHERRTRTRFRSRLMSPKETSAWRDDLTACSSRRSGLHSHDWLLSGPEPNESGQCRHLKNMS